MYPRLASNSYIDQDDGEQSGLSTVFLVLALQVDTAIQG